MTKIIDFSKTRLKVATHIKVVERFVERLASLNVAHNKFNYYREKLTTAISKESLDYKKQTSSSYTSQIADADNRRDRAWGSISSVSRTFAQGIGTAEQTKVATQVQTICNKYKINVNTQLDQESGLLDQAIQDIEALNINLSVIALDKVFAELKESTALVDKLLDERDDERAPIQTGIIKADRIETDKAYDDMIQFLNAVLFLDPTPELDNFADKWNATLNRIRVQVLNSSAVNDSETDEDFLDEEEQEEQTEMPTPPLAME